MKTCATFNVSHMNQLVVDNLHRIRPLGDVVVHVPRSGTIPASLIATYLAKPLCSVNEYIKGDVSWRKSFAGDAKKIVVVDDAMRHANQLAEAVEAIKKAVPDAQVKTLVIYECLEKKPNKPVALKPDLVLHQFPMSLTYMPWFIFKVGRIENECFDFDGVLCRDPAKEEDDDGPKYAAFLKSAEPKFLPLGGRLGTIITARREKYRKPSEEWLKAHGISFGELVMMPDDYPRKDSAKWKAAHFKARKSNLFVESSTKLAPQIAGLAGKTVWCVDNGEFYHGA